MGAREEGAELGQGHLCFWKVLGSRARGAGLIVPRQPSSSRGGSGVGYRRRFSEVEHTHGPEDFDIGTEEKRIQDADTALSNKNTVPFL